MEKATLKILGKSLRREILLPEDLPFPMKKALEALAKPQDEASSESDPKSPKKARCGH